MRRGLPSLQRAPCLLFRPFTTREGRGGRKLKQVSAGRDKDPRTSRLAWTFQREGGWTVQSHLATKESQKAGHRSGIGGMTDIPVSSGRRDFFFPPPASFRGRKTVFPPKASRLFSFSYENSRPYEKKALYSRGEDGGGGEPGGNDGMVRVCQGRDARDPRLHKPRTGKLSDPRPSSERAIHARKAGPILSGRAASLPMGTGGSARGPQAFFPLWVV